MRRLAAAATTLAVMTGAAAAADLPSAFPMMAPAMPSWTGFYLGLNAGGGFGRIPATVSTAGGGLSASAGNNVTGALGGVQAGYNWQMGAMVFGLETDIQGTSMRGTVSTFCTAAVCGVPLAASLEQKVSYFGTVRGRVGYAAGTWMMYATGGYAYADVDSIGRASAGGATGSVNFSDFRSGWTLGGGIEVLLAPQWTARLEYLHLDFGSYTRNFTVGGAPASVSTHPAMDVVRVGANYKF